MMSNVTAFLCPHGYVTYKPQVVSDAYASYIVNIVFNSVFCLPAALVNALVIAAVFTSPALHRPSNMLLCSLAFTDFGVGLIAQPLHATSRAAEVVGAFSTYCTTWLTSRLIGRWLSNASLFTLAAISLDRVLAIVLKTRYRPTVTSRRVFAAIVVMWFLAALIACVRLFAPRKVFLPTVAYSYLVCLVIMFITYCKSFRALRAHQRDVQSHSTDIKGINVVGYRRSLNTMLYIVAVTLVCYLPFILLGTYQAVTGRNPVERAAWTIVDAFVFMSSVFNPLLYYWRIPDFRRAVRTLLRKWRDELRAKLGKNAGSASGQRKPEDFSSMDVETASETEGCDIA